MRESRRVFVVTTPEVTPLHLAALRIRSLRELGLEDRVSLLLNRRSGCGQGLSDAEVVQLVGLPLSFTFSNDYTGVDKAIIDGRPVAPETELGSSILNLAQSLTPQLEVKETSKPRKFLEFFHVPQIKDSDEAWKG
jgi:Flp pilus assembly CpaE family ATPase